MAVNASRSGPFDARNYALRSIDFGAEESDAIEPAVLFIGGPDYWSDRVAPTRPYRVRWHVTAVDGDGGDVVLSIIVADDSSMSVNAVTILQRTVTEPGVFEDTFDFRTVAELLGIDLDGDKWIACAVTFSGGNGAEYVNYSCDVQAL